MGIRQLQKKYPRFVYENYSYRNSGKDLKISFNFKIVPDISFNPTLLIKNIPKLNRAKIDNLIFNLGLVEMISYWKATCSPIIEIKTGGLNREQIKWWQDLIMNGMGQFFFENKISFQKPKFITAKPSPRKPLITAFDDILVPVGGGKDSAVTLELLSAFSKKKLG